MSVQASSQVLGDRRQFRAQGLDDPVELGVDGVGVGLVVLCRTPTATLFGVSAIRFAA